MQHGSYVTVLVVDDQFEVREVVVRCLRTHGYRVLESADGSAALELAAGYRGPIHLLLTDIVMCPVGGPELAARLKADRPDTAVLFMSGYTALQVPERAPFLPKPFTAQMLLRSVEEALRYAGGQVLDGPSLAGLR